MGEIFASDTVRRGDPSLATAVYLMLASLATMLICVGTLYLAPLSVATALGLGTYGALLTAENATVGPTPITTLMTLFYAMVGAGRVLSPEADWLPYASSGLFLTLSAVAFGLLAVGRPFSSFYSRGTGYRPLHVAISSIWGTAHLTAGTAAFVLMPDVSFILAPIGIVTTAAAVTLFLSFGTMGSAHGRKKVSSFGPFTIREVERNSSDEQIYHRLLAEIYRAELRKTYGRRFVVDTGVIEAEHRAHEAIRIDHLVRFLCCEGARPIGTVRIALDDPHWRLPIEARSSLDFDAFRSRGPVAEIGALALIPSHRLDPTALKALFRSVVEVAAEREVSYLVAANFAQHTALYEKVGFRRLLAEPYLAQRYIVPGAEGPRVALMPMVLDLEMSIRREGAVSTTTDEVRKAANQYLIERFFKRSIVRDLLRRRPFGAPAVEPILSVRMVGEAAS